jgi:N-acetylmuramoyl-L-alanine amidase
MKVYVSAGHTRTGRDKGAISPYAVEGELTHEFRNILNNELRSLGIFTIVDADNTIAADTIRFFKSLLTQKSLFIDIHFNSGPEVAHGAEIIIPDAASTLEVELAKSLQNILTEYFRDRGVKREKDTARKQIGVLRQLSGINILLEICFISNKNDVDKYHTNKKKIAKQFAIEIFNFLTKHKL